MPEEEEFTGAEKLFKLYPPCHPTAHFTVPDTSPAGTAAAVAAGTLNVTPCSFTHNLRLSSSLAEIQRII